MACARSGDTKAHNQAILRWEKLDQESGVEEKERNTIGWRMHRELVKQPVTGLISEQAACEIGRQQANCCLRLRRCKLRS